MPYKDKEKAREYARNAARKRRALISKDKQAAYRQSAKIRNNYLKKLYSITHNDYCNLHEKQKGVCAICGQPESYKSPKIGTLFLLGVDHDHNTGKIRGLLCRKCNSALGQCQDSVEWLNKALKYLRSSRGD